MKKQVSNEKAVSELALIYAYVDACNPFVGRGKKKEYIEKAFLSETKAASDLIKQLDLLMERAPLADSIYHQNYDQVRFWVDSIPAVPALPGPR
jgi:hypothetical protein